MAIHSPQDAPVRRKSGDPQANRRIAAAAAAVVIALACGLIRDVQTSLPTVRTDGARLAAHRDGSRARTAPRKANPAASAVSRAAAPAEPAKTVEPSTDAKQPAVAAKAGSPRKEPEWTPLFDGKSLAGWKVTEFGGQGEIQVKDGALVLGMGNDMTGLTIAREVPRINYEVELQAMRVDGSDFFCGLTFPVKDSPCSLIVGGWGGGLCGLSSLDGADASENETTKYKEFKNGRWYPVRLRVTDAKIEAWVDGEQIVDVETAGRRISVRIEVELSRPFGFATWRTKGALRDIRIRAFPVPH